MTTPGGYTREYIKRKNFDWMNQTKVKFKVSRNTDSTIKKIKKREEGIIQNINDVIRVNHIQYPPQPRSVYTIMAGRPKPTLASEISAGLLDQSVKVPQYDKETGEKKKDQFGKTIYKKEKLKDILYKPVGELVRINDQLMSNVPGLAKVANILVNNRVKEKKNTDSSYDENSLYKELQKQGITKADLDAMDNINKNWLELNENKKT